MLTIFGTITMDTVHTPTKILDMIPGGSSMYAGLAASHFVRPNMVAAAGTDFPAEYMDIMSQKADTRGLSVMDGKTFHYAARYESRFERRVDLREEPNIIRDYEPHVPPEYRGSGFVYLANSDPHHQIAALKQFDTPKFSMFDTISVWISTKMDALRRLAGMVDAVVVNDSEARLLACQESVVECARIIHAWGPRYTIIKRGEHGSVLFVEGGRGGIYPLPGFLTDTVVDPTGAGDAFGGALMGHLSAGGDRPVTPARIRESSMYGNVAGSFAVAGYGLEGMIRLDRQTLEARFGSYRSMLCADSPDTRPAKE